MKNGTQKYVSYIVLQSVLYGVMDIVSKQVYREMDTFCFLVLRYGLASLIMLIIWNKQILGDIKSVPFKKYFAPGLCLSLAFIASNLALRYTAATSMAFLRSLSALIAPLLALILYKEKYGKKEPFLQFFMVIGLYLLCTRGGLNKFGLGEVLSLFSSTMIACSLVLGKHALASVSSKTLSFFQAGFSAVFCTIMAIATGGISEIGYVKHPHIIAALLYAAICCTIICYMLQNMALVHISAKQVSIIQCLYPVATAIVAFIVLNERLSVLGIVGAVIITACVVLENVLED